MPRAYLGQFPSLSSDFGSTTWPFQLVCLFCYVRPTITSMISGLGILVCPFTFPQTCTEHLYVPGTVLSSWELQIKAQKYLLRGMVDPFLKPFTIQWGRTTSQQSVAVLYKNTVMEESMSARVTSERGGPIGEQWGDSSEGALFEKDLRRAGVHKGNEGRKNRS